MTETTTFGIVVPTYNEERNIQRLLRSIHSQIDTTYSITVVDQGSADRTAELARSSGGTVIEVDRPQFYSPPARSRNIGARSLTCTILLHLDADMELGSADFLKRLAAVIDSGHRAAVIHEADIATGFWATCKALERSCYRGTQMEAARAVTTDLFVSVGGYDEEISSGEDFFITRLYERETQIASDDYLLLLHHVGAPSLGSMLRKKFAYGRTAGTYLGKAETVGARSASSIVHVSIRAYLANWRLIRRKPIHYICIFPLRAFELAAVQLGLWFGPRSRRHSAHSAKPEPPAGG